jgi:SAM-dependent methyltransferase
MDPVPDIDRPENDRTDYLRANREFFAERASRWDERFPDDSAAFAAAIAALQLRAGDAVADVGCGTGRAVPFLRNAVGAAGTVVGVDAAPEMLDVARAAGRGDTGAFVLADAVHLPVRAGVLDAVFTAGLVPHIPDPPLVFAGFRAFVRAAGRLAIFHPVSRAALAERHGRTLEPGELLDPNVLPGVLEGAGWSVEHLQDDDYYLAVGVAV